MVASKTSLVLAAVALGAASSAYAAPIMGYNDGAELATRGFEDDFHLDARFFDDDELEARYFDDELEARDFDDEEGLFARDFDDEESLYARDFDEDSLYARDFDEEEGLYARDFDDVEHLFARNAAVTQSPAAVAQPNSNHAVSHKPHSGTFGTKLNPDATTEDDSSSKESKHNTAAVESTSESDTELKPKPEHHNNAHHKHHHNKDGHHTHTHGHKHHEAAGKKTTDLESDIPHHKSKGTAHRKHPHATKEDEVEPQSTVTDDSTSTESRKIKKEPSLTVTNQKRSFSDMWGRLTRRAPNPPGNVKASHPHHAHHHAGASHDHAAHGHADASDSADAAAAAAEKRDLSFLERRDGSDPLAPAHRHKHHDHHGHHGHHGHHSKSADSGATAPPDSGAATAAPPDAPLTKRDRHLSFLERRNGPESTAPHGHPHHVHHGHHGHHGHRSKSAGPADSGATAPPDSGAATATPPDADAPLTKRDLSILARSLGLDDDYFFEERSFDDDMYEF